MSARSLLVRGMLVGLAAGVLAYLFATVFGEPPVDAAIAFEDAHTTSGDHDPELVSRTIQSTIGLATAVVVYGAALGGLFALALAVAYGRLGRLPARPTALLVAAAGFVAVELAPFLTYPPNPPAVGNPETIGRRTALHFTLIAITVAAAVGATLLGRNLAARLGTWNAVLVAAGAFVAVVAAAAALLPAVNEVPADFPATVLWRFRLASLGTQLVLWTTLGLLFGALTDRSQRRARTTQPTVA
ncbi:CbtA family protein [Planosporangium flavigriseum]|uniref:Membrane protein n=1 Tax=Planosporangium flavigriseum TaxID=373681 RepID=A0A8J3PNV8_9ACTN|nr:CbtA family protein [Planosporangium flavigriseum]NJC66207.1 CbtA family protein [Planosporangium flavigriseum]GIG76412.1 membrane protein [Planosporangium flavigriseum]